jgi:hypothetical protein
LTADRGRQRRGNLLPCPSLSNIYIKGGVPRPPAIVVFVGGAGGRRYIAMVTSGGKSK